MGFYDSSWENSEETLGVNYLGIFSTHEKIASLDKRDHMRDIWVFGLHDDSSTSAFLDCF